VLGLSADLFGHLTDQEYTEIFTQVIGVTHGIAATLMRAAQRMIFDVARDFRESIRPTNAEITPLFAQGLNLDMVHRIYFLNQPDVTRPMQPNLVAYGKLSFREQLENNAVQAWEPLQKCLAGYDPSRHAPGSDEEFRNRIALTAIDGAPNREEFERRLLDAIDKYMPELQGRRDRFMSLLPVDLVAICDARGFWGNRELLMRMNDAMNRVSEVRKSIRGTPMGGTPTSGDAAPSRSGAA
jgi:hypothetical protein